MSLKKYKKMNKGELEGELREKEAELIDTSFNVSIGKEQNYADISMLKKEVARIKTTLNNKLYKKEESSKDKVSGDKKKKRTKKTKK